MRTFALTLLALAAGALAQTFSGSAASSKSSVASSKSAAASSVSSAISSGISSGSAAGASASALAALSPSAAVCITDAAANSTCANFGNLTCVCTNADFQQKAMTCLAAECQAAEAGAALGLQQSQCGAQSLSASTMLEFMQAETAPQGQSVFPVARSDAIPTATAPFLPSNSAADISGSPSAKTGAAQTMGMSVSLVIGGVVAMFGVGVGGLLL
ncbi:hypothetical protein FB451DRAFT_1401642 [Mycena latifolia]|nr:hypothetical protein FB451DRAFT_1401642 [Mycena latifolia]